MVFSYLGHNSAGEKPKTAPPLRHTRSSTYGESINDFKISVAAKVSAADRKNCGASVFCGRDCLSDCGSNIRAQVVLCHESNSRRVTPYIGETAGAERELELLDPSPETLLLSLTNCKNRVHQF
jgi:hypothetical protein